MISHKLIKLLIIKKKFYIFTGVDKNQSPNKWFVRKADKCYTSPNQKAWIITPIKEPTETLKNVPCKKMLNFHSEPKQSLSNYL